VSRVTVVGAGVVGLSCAVRLAESGHRVDVLARDLPRETTSVIAAALWYPYKALPEDKVTAWGAAAYAAFTDLAEDVAATGVRLLPGTEVLVEPTPDPWWIGAVPSLTRVAPLPGYADAWSFVAPIIDMPIYLDWLRARLESLGGTVTRMSLGGLPAAGSDSDDVVVNCAGMGARLLAADTSVHPVRGQVVVVKGVELDRWWLDESGPTYVIPRSEVVVIGGTDDEDDWSRTPSPETATAILERATRLVPSLARAEVVAHRVGLRPVRPEVRLEAVGRTVHCYGHGGAGVTLSWGCADEVTRLVGELG
jgi:D-amino-acid oxidase